MDGLALGGDERALRTQIANVSRTLDGLEQKLAEVDAELTALSDQRYGFELLSTIVSSLDKLEEAGASDLFWGSDMSGFEPDRQLQRARKSIAAFEDKIKLIEARRGEIRTSIDAETDTLRALNHELQEFEDEAESRRHEFAVDREDAELPYRPLVMPWAKRGEDDRRYHRILLLTLLLSFVFGGGVTWFKPAPEQKPEEIVPEHIAQFVVKMKEVPKPIKKKPAEAPARKSNEKSQKLATASTHPAPTPSTNATPTPGAPETERATRAAAEKKGVLALKNAFAGLVDQSDSAKMGAQGRISDTGQIAPGTAAQRSLIVSKVGGGVGSVGINTSAVSRAGMGGGTGGGGVGTGGGGRSITGSGVKIARVQSSTGAGVADERPLSNGVGPSRTDEEIQIVFDRYKSALYRIYNRELRKDPTLRGKMVLTLTIQPDGGVSACSVKSTDLASPTLVAKIVARVRRLNFGAKAGVPAITINYPIDFLPAA